MVSEFVNGLLSDGKAAIPFKEIVAVTKPASKC